MSSRSSTLSASSREAGFCCEGARLRSQGIDENGFWSRRLSPKRIRTEIAKYRLGIADGTLGFADNKVVDYQLLGDILRRRPGQFPTLKAKKNFGWKSCLVASESNPGPESN